MQQLCNAQLYINALPVYYCIIKPFSVLSSQTCIASPMAKQECICGFLSGAYWGTSIHRRFISDISFFLSNAKMNIQQEPLIPTFIICMATGLWGLIDQLVISSPWSWVYFNNINTKLLNKTEWLWSILFFYKSIWRKVVYLSYFSPCLKEDMPN